ncbi:MAG: MBL fold metallo-hydrolase [Candidatus Binatia bacterium]
MTRGAFGIALAVAALIGCDRVVDRMIAHNLGRSDRTVLTSPDLTVVLCGTGSPLPDRARAGACTAVVAGGELVLVDVGPGAWETVDLANLPTGDLSAILLTHFHSDHIGDLGEAVTQSWVAGRVRPLDVYGPVGTANVVAGFGLAYAQDVEYRVAHHGEASLPRAAGSAVAHEVPLDDDALASAIVFERNGLRVTMFRVDHRPAVPAVGYRFDYRGRSVVISGDTKKSASVARHAAGADLLIHEALQPRVMARVAAVAARLGRPRLAKLAADTVSYHTTPVEAAEVARDAGVRHLVLTHLVPAPGNVLTRRLFADGMADVFAGEITLGVDGMRFTLPPAEPRTDPARTTSPRG